MSTFASFDVIILYNNHLARSASSTQSNVISPFVDPIYNASYGYFLSSLARAGLTAALTTSLDIVGPGKFSSYWTYAGHTWVKHALPCKARQIFDKFSPTTIHGQKLRELVFSGSKVKAFNDPALFSLFFDKQKTYTTLPTYSIPTLSITRSLKNIQTSLAKLSRMVALHPHSADFGDLLIIKDRYGAGGNHIYQFQNTDYTSMQATISSHPTISFIIQPFVHFDTGYTHLGLPRSTDIRLIYLGGKVVTTYLRMASEGDFRCNQHQGGSIMYLDHNDLPPTLLTKADQIASILNKKSSLFTLDFIVSNAGHPYLLEGNTGPGLTWDPVNKIDQAEAKKLIRLIVQKLLIRHQEPISPPPARSFQGSRNPSWPPASKTLYPALALG